MRRVLFCLCLIGFGGCDDGDDPLDGAVDQDVVDMATDMPGDGAPPDLSMPDAGPDEGLDMGGADMSDPDLGDEDMGVACTPADCDDGNPCTENRCDPAEGCVTAPQDGACDDGDPLTAGDQCVAGVCQGVRPTVELGGVDLPPDLSARRAIDAGPLAYVALGGGGLQVLDIQDPTTPREIGRWVDAGLDCTDLARLDTWIYLACGDAGVQVVSVADPAAPEPVGRIEADARAVAIADDVLFVGTATGVVRWSLAAPAMPADSAPVGAPGGAIIRLVVDGGRLYCLFADGVLVIADLADPRAPAELGRVEGPENPTDLAVWGGLAYCTYDGAGLQIVDLRAPERPEVLWTDGGSRATGIALGRDGRTLACIYADGRYVTASLRDRARPETLTDSAGPAPATGVAVFGGGVGYCAYGSRVSVVDFPPFVTGRSPAAAVCGDAPIDLWFNSAIVDGDGDAFTLSRDEMELPVAVEITGRRARITPAAPLTPGLHSLKIGVELTNTRGTRAIRATIEFIAIADCVRWVTVPDRVTLGDEVDLSFEAPGLEGGGRVVLSATPGPLDSLGLIAELPANADAAVWKAGWVAAGAPGVIYATPVIDTPDGAVYGPTVPIELTPVACEPADCDDGDPCTADRCDPNEGCVQTPIPDCAPGFDCSVEGAAGVDGLSVVEAYSNDWLCATEWGGLWHRDPATDTCGELCATLDLACVGARGGDFGWGQPAGTAILGCDVPQPEVATVNGQPDIFCLCDRGPAVDYVPSCVAAAEAAPMPQPAVCADEAGGTAQNANLCLFEQAGGAGTCDAICEATGTRCVTARENDFGFCGAGVGAVRDVACDAPTQFDTLCVCYRGQGEPMDPLICDPGTEDCDGDPANGCEIDTANDPAHCGGCGRQCGADERCVNSACEPAVVLPPNACMVAGAYDDPAAFGLPILNDFQAPGLMVPQNPFVLDGIRYPNNFQLTTGACIPNLDSNDPGCGGENVYLVSFGGPNDIDPVEPVNRLGFRWGDQGDPTTFVVHFVDGSQSEHVIPGRRGFFGYCSPDLAIDRITMSGGDYGIDDIRCDACR